MAPVENGECNKKSNSTNRPPLKRGRKPKMDKEKASNGKSNDEDPPSKKIKQENSNDSSNSTKSREFVQNGPCFEVAPQLPKCIECTMYASTDNVCRFYSFRKLKYTKNGKLTVAGFPDPYKDASEDDLKFWLTNHHTPPPDLDLDTAKFLLEQVGGYFCDLVIQEQEGCAEDMSKKKIAIWKHFVQGVREMCDVCKTTLFNFHWICGHCGFVVCIDCYKNRKKGIVWGEPGENCDKYLWLFCTNGYPHKQDGLFLTQIIPGDALLKLGRMVHEMRDLWNIDEFCECTLHKDLKEDINYIHVKELVKSILNCNKANNKNELKSKNVFLDTEVQCEPDENMDSLRCFLMKSSCVTNDSFLTNSPKEETALVPTLTDLDNILLSVVQDKTTQIVKNPAEQKTELKYFIRKYNWNRKGRAQPSIRIMTLTESKILYPDVQHSWLCDGKLLRLIEPLNDQNYPIFQEQWKRGQPVIVSNVTDNMNLDLWRPESFIRDFGKKKNDLINCFTGNIVPNQPMYKFWEGFDYVTKRLKDEYGTPMLLKIKDWPPGDDFAEIMPTRYADLMKVLPLSEYTDRSGKLNLASRLPASFIRPDLGPKMYNAYGSALYPTKGTTNLHLDVSDAVNVMVYVGVPKDVDFELCIKEVFTAIDEAGCDILTRKLLRNKRELPGALWHIYDAKDADKIRDLLNKTVVESGGRLESHNDPIHDQRYYLDRSLRERLYREYGVEGYSIVQFQGDAVFIPAGAPHQVQNLHNCIKVAEDFVSAENVAHCFHLTQEFRELSDKHTNHEDKLQIKNIIYHTVKDSLSMLCSIMNKHATA